MRSHILVPFTENQGNITYIGAAQVIVGATKENALSSRTPYILSTLVSNFKSQGIETNPLRLGHCLQEISSYFLNFLNISLNTG